MDFLWIMDMAFLWIEYGLNILELNGYGLDMDLSF